MAMKEIPGLYKRGRLYWFARQTNGVRKFIPLGTDDLSVALKKVEQLAGSHILPDKSDLLALVEPFLAHKVKLREYSASSVESKRAVLMVFARRYSISADKVTKATVQEFYHFQIERGLAAETVSGYINVLRSFFRWMIEVRALRHDNPTNGLQMVRSTRRGRKEFCTPEQVDKLISECPRQDLKFCLFCGFHAGLRKQEIIEAKAFWFDLAAGILHLRKHPGINFKDGDERSIPLTNEFRAFLAEYGLPEPYMLHPDKVKGKSLYRYDFELPFETYVQASGLPWVKIHTMRHTFASLLASAGEPLYNIAVWLGDGIQVVQRHYAKLLPIQRDIGKAFAPRPSGSASAEAAPPA